MLYRRIIWRVLLKFKETVGLLTQPNRAIQRANSILEELWKLESKLVNRVNYHLLIDCTHDAAKYDKELQTRTPKQHKEASVNLTIYIPIN